MSIQTISVTRADIKAGEPIECSKCPVALAIKRAFPGSYVSVSRSQIEVDRQEYRTPRSVDRFIMRFDECKRAHPFAFKLIPTGRS